MLMPLDDLASQEYKDSLYPVVTEALTVNGTMYAAARDITPKVMYINTKMFKDAGVEIPSEDWTMDDFVEVAKQLTKGSGADAQWGYYWKNYTDQTFAMIAAFGGKLYSEDGKASVLSTDPKTKEAVQFMYDLCNCPACRKNYSDHSGNNHRCPISKNRSKYNHSYCKCTQKMHHKIFSIRCRYPGTCFLSSTSFYTFIYF